METLLKKLFKQEDFELKISEESNSLQNKSTMGFILHHLYIQSQELDFTNPISRQKLILTAPRLIRGVLDYKIEYLNRDRRVSELVIKTSQVVMDIYSNPKEIPNILMNYENFFYANYMNLLDVSVMGEIDDFSWKCSSPENSEKSVKELIHFFDGGDILFLPIAHGGIIAGMYTFLRYQEKSNHSNSLFYPIRLSIDKKSDNKPQLTREEENYLREIKGKRSIVVFDEDVVDGTTTDIFGTFIRNKLFPGSDVLVKVNCDYREERKIKKDIYEDF